MRKTIGLFACLVLLSGCGSDNSATTGTSSRLTGVWATHYSIPGASTDMTLQVATNQVMGTGNYHIEAGRSGTFTVTGTVSDPGFNMTLHYDYGTQAVYQGTLTDSSHLNGTLHVAGFADSTLALVRQ